MMQNIETSTNKKPGTILFVDDEPLSLKYFQATVGKYAPVRTASSPDAAMEILEAEGEEISVVVSDERMPRESGVSFLSDVRKSWPSTVRILTSAYADIDNLQQAINDAAIYRFVPKPWNLDELCAAMRDALQVERSASALMEPVLRPTSGGDAEDANLALLAILAAGFDAPLKSLGSEADELSRLSGPTPLEVSRSATAYMSSWSASLRLARISAAAGQVRKDVEHCAALAGSIAKLARGLAKPSSAPASSMADTLHEVIEQCTRDGPGRPTIDGSCDFTYRIPREIMKFVLSNLLRGGSNRHHGQVASPAHIQLFAGAAHNEVRISLGDGQSCPALDTDQSARTVRSALWAFGGELLAPSDENLSKSDVVVCVPKAI
jgi:two-component system, probable response regulator PhcQ